MIIRHVKAISNLDLSYSKHTSFDLIVYYDADFTESKVACKNTSGTCQFLGYALISWYRKNQNCVILFTIEEKYFAVDLRCAKYYG